MAHAHAFLPRLEPAKNVLSQLPPCPIWKYFLRCTEIPRGSGNTAQIREELVKFGKAMGYETIQDKIGNVLIRKPASPGFENKPGVCIQAHMDMVCSGDDPKFDFVQSPLTPRIVNGEWLMATGTSLGGDNGIGLATLMAVLEDKSLVHPPLEALFTMDEEVGLVGASNLDIKLNSKYLINVDDEQEGGICIGCAGGFRVYFSMPITRKPIPNGVTYHVKLTKLVGGHSGVDINKNRGNAIKLFNRILNHAFAKAKFGILSISHVNPSNVIPRECGAKVVVPAEDAAEFEKRVNEMFQFIRKEYQSIEKNMALELSKEGEPTANPISIEDTKNFIQFLTLMPFGVMRMSPNIPELVETSYNIATVDLKDKVCEFSGSARSSSGSQMDDVYVQLKALAELTHVQISEPTNSYPGWLPDPNSKLLKILQPLYKEVTGIEPRVYAIHAGLECGVIQSKAPGIDCVAFGPTIESVHSPSERVFIPSVPRFYNVLTTLIRNID